MSDQPLVYIILLNWNGLSDTLDCLASLQQQEYRNRQIVVVDNASSENPIEIIRAKFPEVIVLQSETNLGFTGGNNLAIQYALEKGADYLWILNNDAVVDCDTLARLVSTAETSTKIGMVSPVIHYFKDPEQIQNCGGYVDWENFVLYNTASPEQSRLWQHERAGDIWLWGTALLVKRDVISTIGFFDDKLFAYWEDTDLSVRATRAGYRNVIDLKARIYHKSPLNKAGTVQRSPYYFYYMARNEYYFWMKYSSKYQKLKFMKEYCGNVIYQAAPCLTHHVQDCAEACFAGAKDAFNDVHGEWNRSRKCPDYIRFIMNVVSWHPHFWSMLIKGKFQSIVTDAAKKTKMISSKA